MLFFSKMICIVGVVVLLFSITAEARIGNSTEPTSYCTETEECLLFDLICNGTEYEVRHYEAAKWVTTEEKSMFKDVAIMKAFKRLFNYITGENEAGVKIPMTAPVLIKVKEEMPFLEPAVYGVSFLLPSAYQDNASKPTDSTVHLEEMTDMDVYVMSYGGWMVGPVSTIYADLLKKALDDVKATYNTDYHYDAGYNSPMKLLNRHNEVWYVVSGAPVCPPDEHPSP